MSTVKKRKVMRSDDRRVRERERNKEARTCQNGLKADQWRQTCSVTWFHTVAG